MFERVSLALVAVAAACATAALGVFAAGLALYLWFEPALGAAGAAGTLAAIAAFVLAAPALYGALRRRAREQESERMRAAVMDELSAKMGESTGARPLLSLAAALVGGVFAARHPELARDAMAVLSAWSRRRAD